jgi:hypothetical protein
MLIALTLIPAMAIFEAEQRTTRGKEFDLLRYLRFLGFTFAR